MLDRLNFGLIPIACLQRTERGGAADQSGHLRKRDLWSNSSCKAKAGFVQTVLLHTLQDGISGGCHVLETSLGYPSAGGD